MIDSPPAPVQTVIETIKVVPEHYRGHRTPDGIHGVVHKAKEHTQNAVDWTKEHPAEAALIGAGVTIGTLLAGWTIWRAFGPRRRRYENGRRRNQARSIDIVDELKAGFPANAMEKRALLDEIDIDDEEFLEFLELFPSATNTDPEAFAEAIEKLALDLS